MNNLGTVELQTERLILRRYRRIDFLRLNSVIGSDERVQRYVAWELHKSRWETYSKVNKIVRGYKKSCLFDWVIELKDTHKLIGTISSRKQDGLRESGDFDGSVYDVGYSIGYDFWGKGYMPEALIAVKNFMFERCDLDILVACHDVNNPTSGKVMQKVGMNFFYDKENIHQRNKSEESLIIVYKLENPNKKLTLHCNDGQ